MFHAGIESAILKIPSRQNSHSIISKTKSCLIIFPVFRRSRSRDRRRSKERDTRRSRERDDRKDKDRERGGDKDRKDRDRGDRDRDRGDRDRDRDRERERDRGERDRGDRDKDNNIDRDRNRTHNRDKDREKDKERERDKEKRRSRDKERSREREREHNSRDRSTHKVKEKSIERDPAKEYRSKSRGLEPKLDDLPPEERDLRTVFCMQLSQRIRAKDLEEFFSSVGKVRDVRLITCNKTRRFKGIAYIEFKDAESVPLVSKWSNWDIKLFFLRSNHSIYCPSMMSEVSRQRCSNQR